MVTIKYDGIETKFASEYTEISLQDLDVLHNIFSKEAKEIDQWIQAISYLSGLNCKVIEEFPIEHFLNIIGQMFIRIPEVDHTEYLVFEDRKFQVPVSPSLNVRQTAAIEKVLYSKDKNKFAQICGLMIFEITGQENLSFEDKVKLFEQQDAKYFITYLLKFNTAYVSDLLNTLKFASRPHETITIT